jgi:hypothetical protein
MLIELFSLKELIIIFLITLSILLYFFLLVGRNHGCSPVPKIIFIHIDFDRSLEQLLNINHFLLLTLLS